MYCASKYYTVSGLVDDFDSAIQSHLTDFVNATQKVAINTRVTYTSTFDYGRQYEYLPKVKELFRILPCTDE